MLNCDDIFKSHCITSSCIAYKQNHPVSALSPMLVISHLTSSYGPTEWQVLLNVKFTQPLLIH